LENIIKRIILFGEEQVIKGPLRSQPHIKSALLHLPPPLRDNFSKDNNITLKRIGKEAAEVVEKEVIQRTLRETHWNRKEAAKVLQISYKALLYKIKKYQLDELKSMDKLREELGWPIQQRSL
jgi:two-component system response regulator AtoC